MFPGVSIPMPANWLQRMKRPPTHPGVIFRDYYRQAYTVEEISQAECARRMGISINRLNEIERGRRGVSAETAVLMGAITGTSPEMWFRMQTNRDMWFALQKLKAQAKKIKRLKPPRRATEAEWGVRRCPDCHAEMALDFARRHDPEEAWICLNCGPARKSHPASDRNARV